MGIETIGIETPLQNRDAIRAIVAQLLMSACLWLLRRYVFHVSVTTTAAFLGCMLYHKLPTCACI